MHPSVTICLTTHLKQNEGYLKAALRGLLWQKCNFGIEIFVVSSAESPPDLPPHPSVTLLHKPEFNNATKKVDHVMGLMHPKSKFFMFHSDDVCLSGNSLQSMVDADSYYSGLQNPHCNGDVPGKYMAPLFLNNQAVPTHLDLAQMDPYWDALQHYGPKPLMLIPFSWVSFYCTLVPRHVLNTVGKLDERLEVKNNDVDYCFRAGKHRIPSFVNFQAVCIHFGSKTLSVTKKAGDDAAADLVFKEKYNL